jgi:hypothetical protein
MICVRATTKRLANASNRHQHEASQNQECRFAASAAQLERGRDCKRGATGTRLKNC